MKVIYRDYHTMNGKLTPTDTTARLNGRTVIIRLSNGADLELIEKPGYVLQIKRLNGRLLSGNQDSNILHLVPYEPRGRAIPDSRFKIDKVDGKKI